jgi:hypothetical protein
MSGPVITVEIVVEPIDDQWRPAFYAAGEFMWAGPSSPDYDVALLYARHAEDLARSLIGFRSAEASPQTKQ